MERLGEHEFAEPNREWQVPKRVVTVGKWGVCPYESQSRGDEQNDAASRLDVDEAFECVKCPLG
jgi:hypothetical protein